jgi:hypothetical protein
MYKKNFCEDILDLNSFQNNPNTMLVIQDNTDNPFEILNDFDFEEYYLTTLTTALFNPPLTLKLFPKSNLYGHELIRYYDL